jgi:hypothetical protein
VYVRLTFKKVNEQTGTHDENVGGGLELSVSQNDDEDQQVSDQTGKGEGRERVAERDREQFAQIVHVVLTF